MTYAGIVIVVRVGLGMGLGVILRPFRPGIGWKKWS